MGLALVATVLLFYIGMRPAGDNAPRILVWSAAALGPLASLLVAIGILANRRFLSAQDIDAAAGGPPSDGARIAQAIIQNTLEQAVLALGVYGLLAATAPKDRLGLSMALAIAFVVGRIAFAVGYRRGAAGRAFGFGLTFYPTVGGFFYAAWLVAQAWR